MGEVDCFQHQKSPTQPSRTQKLRYMMLSQPKLLRLQRPELRSLTSCRPQSKPMFVAAPHARLMFWCFARTAVSRASRSGRSWQAQFLPAALRV
jgi:hypothetical protein